MDIFLFILRIYFVVKLNIEKKTLKRTRTLSQEYICSAHNFFLNDMHPPILSIKALSQDIYSTACGSRVYESLVCCILSINQT